MTSPDVTAKLALLTKHLAETVAKLRQPDGTYSPIGQKGDPGRPGKDAPPFTAEVVAEVVTEVAERIECRVDQLITQAEGILRDDLKHEVEDRTEAKVGPAVAVAVAALPLAKDGEPGDPGKPGRDGKDGDDGEPGIVWRGEWAPGAYKATDAVGYEGSSFIATVDTRERPSVDARDWDLVARKGRDGLSGGGGGGSVRPGPRGDPGADGVPGPQNLYIQDSTDEPILAIGQKAAWIKDDLEPPELWVAVGS